MRYYKVENRILFQTKDEDDKVIGFGVKQPTYMKKYPYNKLGFKADGTETIIQSEVAIPEAQELTLEEAQSLENTWAIDRELVQKVTEVDGEKIIEEEEASPIDIAKQDLPEKEIERNRLHSLYGIWGEK